MSQFAAHLVDHVLPQGPARQLGLVSLVQNRFRTPHEPEGDDEMPSQPRTRAKLFMTGALALLLGGCGGGGGGGVGGESGGTAPPATGGGTPPPASGNGLIAFMPSNMGRVAGYPLWSAEMIMRLGQLVSDDIATPANQSGLGGCPGGGNLQREWTDRDGSNSLSAGDEISLQYSGCSRHPLTGGMDGRATVTLVSVTANGDFEAHLVLPQPGVAIGYTTGLPGDSNFRITGQTQVTVSHTELRQTLAVGDDSDAEISVGFPDSSVAPDRITALHLSKTHRWDEARTHVEMRMRFESPELGGAYQVATTTPLIAWLDTLPEPGPQQGEIQMRGRGGDEVRVQVAGAGSPDPADIGGWLDQSGDGTREAALTGRWSDAGMVTGVFFADYTRGGRGNAYAYDPNEFQLRRTGTGAGATPVESSFAFQFTRPVANASAWRWRLLDKGRLDQMPTAGVEVPVQAELFGALIKLRPASALRYSRRYELLVETGEPSTNGQQMHATTGGSLSVYGGFLGDFRTPDFLNTQATFLNPATLMAGVPFEIAGFQPPADAPPSLRYQWTQVSGTPLTIAHPSERTTLLGLAAGATGVGSATIRLTVSLDGAGNSESADYVLRTVAGTSDAWLSRLRVPLSEDWNTPPKEFWSGPAVGEMTATRQGDQLTLAYVERADPDNRNGDWRIHLKSADGQLLQPGRYTNAYSTGWFDRPSSGASTMDFTSGIYQLSVVRGEFTIHELEVDTAGVVTKLALDFVAPRNNVGPVNSSGSVRINSQHALPP
jgi:hypothetical protein